MIPTITFQQLRNIEFPIFPLPKGELSFRDGLLKVDSKVVDDKNMPGDSLGLRRLQTSHKIAKLRKAVPDLVRVVECGKLEFIDSKGRIFRYEKRDFLPIIYKKIRKIESRDTYSIMWLVGIDIPFTLKRPPQEGEEWAGVLYLKGMPWDIYELCRSYQTPKKKKV